jgi:hypothetical protein
MLITPTQNHEQISALSPAQEFDSGIECQGLTQKTRKCKDTGDGLTMLGFK